MVQSNIAPTARKPRQGKQKRPSKPYAGFPLGLHSSGRWCKRINSRLFYFGRWDRSPDGDWKAALELYESQRDALYSGRAPATPGETEQPLTVYELKNEFLTSMKKRVEGIRGRKLSRRMFVDYKAAGSLLADVFGME